jgi:cell division protein ZapA
MEDKLSIRINIADRYYPLKIERDDEEKIRKAAKMINDKVFQYKTRYADKDIQDFLAMAALQFVIKLSEMESKDENSDLFIRIQKISELLDEIVDTQQNDKNVLLHTVE